MEHERGAADDGEASLLSRRQFVRAAGVLSSTAAIGAASGAGAAAETTALDVASASANHTWTGVELSNSYADPVVVAPTLSYRGTNPASPRLRDVGADQFELRVEEWRYLDGRHLTETVGYVAADPGASELADGTLFETGRVRTDHGWASVSFASSFDRAPVVFSNEQTVEGSQPVVTRNRDVSASGAAIRLQEEEAGGWHREEDVGYLAIEAGSGTVNGRSFEAGRRENVGHGWQTISFSAAYRHPVFLADVQTYRGSNTASVRYRNLTEESVEVKVEEERSRDGETAHLGESVGYLVVEGASSAVQGYGMGGYGAGGYGQ